MSRIPEPNIFFEVYFANDGDILLVLDGLGLTREFKTLKFEADESIDNVVDAALKQIMEYAHDKAEQGLRKHLKKKPGHAL